MSIFKKLFGQETPTTETNLKKFEFTPACKTEQELIERYCAIGLDKQRDLYSIIGDNAWNVDIQKSEISFGDKIVFPIQVLGTFSHSSETWLWSWANTKSGLPESIIQQAIELKKYGEENSIDLLQNSDFAAQTNDLHLIGMIASGMFDSSAYYLANYGQGTMVVTIKSDMVDKMRKEDQTRIATVVPELFSLFEMNHKTALTNYLAIKGFDILEEQNKLIGTKNGIKITAEFDDQFRMTKLIG